MDIKNLPEFVIEWSHSQKFFHVQPTHKSIKDNLSSLFDGREPNYIPVGFANSRDEANEFIAEIKKQLQKN